METTESLSREVPSDEERSQLRLAPLSEGVTTILGKERASPRLVAHLTLVQSTALALLARVKKAWPQLVVEGDAVVFGAATHDIGKARHPEELSEPGTKHEAAGRALLLEHGTPPELARFAETHGQAGATALQMEDLLVIAADTAWKAKRRSSPS
jgi:putative nucleotidyltransferase with HDIG domain